MQAVAVSLLFSFLNPEHERRLGARLRAALPDVPVYMSSEVLPEIKEFERTSTTAVCAYVGPILASYLERLESATREQGLPRLYVMGSNGGVLEAAETVAMPAMAVESGPAAGVVAAAIVARQTGRPNLLSFDMGGTTAKASLIRNGQYETTPEYEVGGGASGNRWMHGTGHPIRVPVIDLAEVSAGGGSIAWVDRAGALRVGPQSAGADPGPACYARGGTEPTVTDCNLRARLSRQGLAAGGRSAHRSRRGGSRGRQAPRRAAGRGCAHGGGRRHRRGQPRHGGGAQDRVRAARPRSRACSCSPPSAARARCMPPRSPPSSASPRCSARPSPARSRRSASSAAISSATTCAPSTPPPRRPIPRRWRPPSPRSRRRAAACSIARGVAPERRRFERSVDARYERQSYELAIPVPSRALDAAALQEIAEAFHDRHRATYGHDNRGEPVQLVSARLTAVGAIPPLLIRDKPAPAGTDAVKGNRRVWFRETGEVERHRLRPRAHAGGTGRAGTGGDRVARIHHPRPARLAGDDERRRLRAADAPHDGEERR